jgi:hypothetical protein
VCGWLSEPGINYQWLSGRFSKVCNHGSQKSENWFWYITAVFKQNLNTNKYPSTKKCWFFAGYFVKGPLFLWGLLKKTNLYFWYWNIWKTKTGPSLFDSKSLRLEVLSFPNIWWSQPELWKNTNWPTLVMSHNQCPD